MTDKDVVKALDVLKQWQRLAYHNDDGTDEDSHELYEALTLMFDYINRQQMKIESISRKAKAEITILLAERDVAKQEVERLSVMVIELQNQLKTAKAEIEELKISNFQFISDINAYKAEIERLRRDRYLIKENGEITLLPRTDIGQIKAEIVRELFLDLEKEKKTYGGVNVYEWLKRRAKELVGE